MTTTALVAFLADAAIKGALVIVAAACAAALLRRRSAALRHAIWTAAVVAQLMLPVLGAVTPAWTIPLPAVPQWLTVETTTDRNGTTNGDPNTAQSRPATSGTTPTDPAASPRTSSPNVLPDAPSDVRAGSAAQSPTTGSAPRALSLVTWLWVAGTVLVMLRLLAGTVGVWRLARQGRRVADGRWLALTQHIAERLGISRPLTLLRGGSLGVPVTWGIVYPVVLLPSDADSWDAERLRYVLVHEMAHVRRLDALTQLLAQLTAAVFWFSPFVWLASARLRLEREHACDDYVLREGTLASRYAEDLLSMVQLLGTPEHRAAQPAFAALAMARRSEFEGRMLAILDAHHDRHPLSSRGVMMLAAAVLLLAAPLAALSPVRAGPEITSSVVRGDSASPRGGPAPVGQEVSASPAPSGTARVKVADGRACDTVDVRADSKNTTTSSHIHATDDDATGQEINLLITTPGRCAEADIRGDVAFASDERTVTRVAPGAIAVFRERSVGADWTARWAPGDGEPAVTRDGRAAAYDDDARRWLGGFIPAVLREAGVHAPARVARLRAVGGVNAVLEAIANTQSHSARRAHYVALLAMPDLSPDDLGRIVRHAGRELGGSPSDLRAVMDRVPASARQAPGVRDALTDALSKMTSDAELRVVLTQYVTQNDRGMMLTALEAVKRMQSDSDRRVVLVSAAPIALGTDDETVRRAFFKAFDGMQSDTDRRIVLTAALPYGHAVPAVTSAVLRATGKMGSDTDRATVLIAAAAQRLISTPALRDEYLDAAKKIGSDGELRRVLQAVMKP